MLGGAAPPHGTTVTVQITDVRSTKGVIRACMTDNRSAFPRCRGVPGAHAKVLPASRNASFTFEIVAPGNYAIALLHDENNNGKADRAMGMMPKEGFGFSRDAPVRMAPPKFDDAVFAVGTSPVRQTIRMRYML